MQIADPEHWLEALKARVADVRAKSAAMTESIASSAATVTSTDGAVTVTVAPTGALQNLELKPRAAGMSPGKLTASIMEAVRTGQRSASAKVVEAFAPLGAGTESMDLVLSYLPPAEDTVQQYPEEDFAKPPEAEHAPMPPHSPATRPQPQPAPPRQAAKPARPQPDEDVAYDNNPW